MDTERLAVRVDVQVLAQLGWVMTEAEVVERFVGLSDATIREAIEAHTGRRLADNWEQEFRHLYRSSFAESLTAVDGVVEALDGITLRTCVASSGSHEKMRFTLGLTGLLPRFDGRFWPEKFGHNNDYAAARMGVAPAACAVVEDSRFGVEAARAAGMRAFGYAGGLTPAHLLAGSGTIVFTDMRELPRLLNARSL